MKYLFLSVLLLISTLSLAQFQVGQTLRIMRDGKALCLPNSSVSADVATINWTDTDTPSQRWVIEDNGAENGTFYLRNAYSGYYLGSKSTLTNGATIVQMAKNRARCSWELVPVEGKEGVYYLYAGSTRRLCLASAAKFAEGSAITVQLPATTTDKSRIEWTVDTTAAQSSVLTAEKREEMMQRWMAQYYHKAGTGHVIGKGGWWGDAEMFEVVDDAYETTGLSDYATMFNELYLNFCSRNGTDWSGNSYNDDISWMCIACVRAYLLTGTTEYLTRARSNFDKMYTRANAYGNGTLIWCQGKTGTNSCINGPAAVCACYLGLATGLESYFEKAASIYAGERACLFNINSKGVFNGQVYDSYSTDEKKVSNTWSSTYNQGTCLGAAVMLYDHYGTDQYKSDATKIWQWTKSNLANSEGIIKVCQTVTGDLTGFKGILMRYIRRYAEDLDAPECYDFLAKNAWRAFNNRNSAGISMSAWLTKTPEDFTYSDGGDFSTDGVGAFTAVSAAYNAHLGVIATRSAFEWIEAENFNYICGGSVSTLEDGTGIAGPLMNAASMGYRRVNFGDSTATHIILNMCRIRTSAKVYVYADGPNAKTGTLLCTITEPAENGTWGLVSAELSTPLTGVHDIYLTVSGTKTLKLASIDNFMFQTDEMASSLPSVMQVQKQSNASLYDLLGRRVVTPQNGHLYIQGGRKVLY